MVRKGGQGKRPGPNLAETPCSETILSRGGSCIVNPLGQILAGPNYSEECILTAELDLADMARGKFDFDVVGHYARPDIFSLHVNEHPQSPVIHNED